MSLKNKPTYGTVPAVDSGATKGSRRNLVVGLVRGGPTQTDNCCQVFGSCPEGYKSSGTVVPNTACCKDPNKGLSMSSDMPMCPDGGSVFGPSKSPFGPDGFDGGMGMGMGMGGPGPIKTPSYKNMGY